MAQDVDLGGLNLHINGLYVGATTPGSAGTAYQSSTGAITLPAGTATAAPENFVTGTSLTTAAAGAVEFDGVAFYDTAVASSRQLRDDEQYIRQVGDSAAASNAGLDTSAASAVFTSPTNGTITLPASTSYWFEAQYYLTNTGTTSHTWSTLFAGTATTSGTISYAGSGLSTGTANTPATGSLNGFASTAGAVVFTPASTSSTEQVSIQLAGSFRTATAGTLIPQMKASARPGASGTAGVIVKEGSFFRIWPIGVATNASVGNWS